jgi:hypothetical protein
MTEETITKLASIADAARSLAKAAALNGVKPEDLQAIVLGYANKTIKEDAEKATKDVVSLERGPEPTMRYSEVRMYLMDTDIPMGRTGAHFWTMHDELIALFGASSESSVDEYMIPTREVKFIVDKFDPTGVTFRELECHVNTHIPA